MTSREPLDVERLREELVNKLGAQFADGREPDLTLLVVEAVRASQPPSREPRSGEALGALIHGIAAAPPATRAESWACYWRPGDEDPDQCFALGEALAAALGDEPYIRGYARGWDAALDDAATDPHRAASPSPDPDLREALTPDEWDYVVGALRDDGASKLAVKLLAALTPATPRPRRVLADHYPTITPREGTS